MRTPSSAARRCKSRNRKRVSSECLPNTEKEIEMPQRVHLFLVLDGVARRVDGVAEVETDGAHGRLIPYTHPDRLRVVVEVARHFVARSEEHTSELQSL